MDNAQFDKLINLLGEAIVPYKKYIRDLRWQSWIKAFFIVFLLVEGILFFRSVGIIKGVTPETNPSYGIGQKIEFNYLMASAKVDDLVAVVDISGVISEDSGLNGNMTEDVKSMLASARDNPRVKAVILRVQSPGGSVNASNLIWNEVMKFKKTGKPVVAFFNGIAASGGYYVSAPADKIIATPETWTGSIGVIMQSPNFSKLLDKVGVKFTTIKSGSRKDMFSSFKPADKEDEKLMQKIVDNAFNRFVVKVAQGRKMNEKTVRVLADGRIYDAEQALNNKLIDRIGYIEDAFSEAKKLAKLNDASLVQYQKKKDMLEEFFAAISSKPLIKVEQPFSAETPGLYYLWTNGN